MDVSTAQAHDRACEQTVLAISTIYRLREAQEKCRLRIRNYTVRIEDAKHFGQPRSVWRPWEICVKSELKSIDNIERTIAKLTSNVDWQLQLLGY